MDEVNGRIEAVLYASEDSGYAVLRVATEDGGEVSVVGCIPLASPGEAITAQGSWEEDPVYGPQFRAEYTQRMLPGDTDSIYAFLCSGAVRGIGPVLAGAIVDRFGDRTLAVMEKEPHRLQEIRGISQKMALEMSAKLRNLTTMRELIDYIGSFGLPPEYASRLYGLFGMKALDRLQENPYLLCSESVGASFMQADQVAMELGYSEENSERLMAAALYELRYNCARGHCFIPFEKLSDAASRLTGMDTESVDAALEELIARGDVEQERIGNLRACYLHAYRAAETDSAARLAALQRNVRKIEEAADFTAIIAQMEGEQQISYTDLQKKTLDLVLRNGAVILTGGPGTGKTTSLRAVLALFRRLGLSTLLAAPTGRAAQRLAELTGQSAQTLHRLLEVKSGSGLYPEFGRCAERPLHCDAVIVDECSMLDIFLLQALLNALPDGCRLLLVGDADQLPPVGPGKPFADLIRSETLPTVRLKEIFRQKENSAIVRYAHAIHDGRWPDFTANREDFFTLTRSDPESAAETIRDLFSRRLPEKMKFRAEDIQVLSPTRKGPCGTDALNRILQESLNPPGKEKKERVYGTRVFREGDRVMQIRNNYNIEWKSEDGSESGVGIFNGDIGRIESLHPESESLTLNFDGRRAEYTYSMLRELEHAWALTVHKSQGSEYPAVLLAMNRCAPALLTREVLYTAVSRARKLLVMVGDPQVAMAMVENGRQARRYSGLRARMAAAWGPDVADTPAPAGTPPEDPGGKEDGETLLASPAGDG